MRAWGQGVVGMINENKVEWYSDRGRYEGEQDREKERVGEEVD